MDKILTLENEIRELRKIIKDKEDEMEKIRKELTDVSIMFVYISYSYCPAEDCDHKQVTTCI